MASPEVGDLPDVSPAAGVRPQTSPATGSSGRPADTKRASSAGLGSAAVNYAALLGEVGNAKDDAQSLVSLDETYAARNFTSALSTHASEGGNHVPQKEHEQDIGIAELETRIRRFNLQLMQPTIQKTTLIEQEMVALRDELRRSTLMITDLASTRLKVEEQVVVVEGFREEMSKWENERRVVQAHVAEELCSMKQDLDNYRYSLERKDASIHSVQRTMDRLVGELSKVQEGSEALRQHVDHRLSQSGKVLSSASTDLECKLIGLETKLNKLSDDLWGEETGLAKATSNLTQTNELVMSLTEEMKRMHHDKANVTQLEAVQDDVNELIRDANCNVVMLKQTVDTMVNDVKAHFTTATNTVAAHNATMLSEVRASYQEELSHTAALRGDVTQFMKETQENMARIENVVQSQADETSGLVKKVAVDVDELNRLAHAPDTHACAICRSMHKQ
jgi:hypothetical protein